MGVTFFKALREAYQPLESHWSGKYRGIIFVFFFSLSLVLHCLQVANFFFLSFVPGIALHQGQSRFLFILLRSYTLRQEEDDQRALHFFLVYSGREW